MTNTARSTSGKAAPAKARFGQDSVEFKSLLTMFKSADIQPTEKPASVRARCPKLFEKFTPAQFRAQHSKARTLSGVQGEHHGSVFDFLLLLLSNFLPVSHEPDPEQTPVPEVNVSTVSSIAPAPASVIATSVASSPVDEQDATGEDPLTWVPKKLASEHLNKDGVPCVAMLISLSGGTCIDVETDFEVRLVDDGWTALCIEKWAHHCSDVREHYSRHPREHDITDEDWIRRQLALGDEIDRVRKSSANGGMVSVCRCQLPWKAAEIADTITGAHDGARTCHIDIYSKQRVQKKKIFVGDARKPKGKSAFGSSPSPGYSMHNGA